MTPTAAELTFAYDDPYDYRFVPVSFEGAVGEVTLTVNNFFGSGYGFEWDKGWISQVQEIAREPVPFWIVVAGGKRDFTIKWWQHERFQKASDHFKGEVLFVQVGEAEVTADTGWLCDNAGDYVSAVREIVGNAAILRRKGEAARQRAVERFRPERWIETLLF